jgi:hypothetical protein
LELPESLSAEDRAELVEMARELDEATDSVAQGVLQRLLAARMVQLGVTTVRPEEQGVTKARARLARAVGGSG